MDLSSVDPLSHSVAYQKQIYHLAAVVPSKNQFGTKYSGLLFFLTNYADTYKFRNLKPNLCLRPAAAYKGFLPRRIFIIRLSRLFIRAFRHQQKGEEGIYLQQRQQPCLRSQPEMSHYASTQDLIAAVGSVARPRLGG